MEIIGTIYSHHLGFDRITEILHKHYPAGTLFIGEENGSQIVVLELERDTESGVRAQYRERAKPSYQIPQVDDSPLTGNLKGLYGYVKSLPTSNEKVKDMFLQKIMTLNSEFTISASGVEGVKELMAELASKFDAVVFVQPNTVISKSTGQHFLDRDLNLIIDGKGNCEIDNLDVKIDSKYFDKDLSEVTQEQIDRKERNDALIRQNGIKVNEHLPVIESEEECEFRTPQEIAQRVTVLAVTNLVAFGNITGEKAIDYLQHYGLWDYVTPNEIEFLENPTDDRKQYETWKCECIWTLMWALGRVDDLGSPNELCSLQNIPTEEYPVTGGKDPNDFINAVTSMRNKAEILDMNDLYYRLDWACVDARINKQQMQGAHPGVVYERHYALNWLIGYGGLDWDDVTCDT